MKIKQKIENWLLKRICNVVIIDDIIKYNIRKDKFYFKNKEVDVRTLKEIKEEAEFLRHTEIWKIITNTLKEEARLTMNERSASFEDMRSGKLLLYAISLQEKIIDKFK